MWVTITRYNITKNSRYLFDLPDGVRSSISTEYFTKLSLTNLRMIARALATKIYFFFSSPGQPEGHWDSYAGTHVGPVALANCLEL